MLRPPPAARDSSQLMRARHSAHVCLSERAYERASPWQTCELACEEELVRPVHQLKYARQPLEAALLCLFGAYDYFARALARLAIIKLK